MSDDDVAISAAVMTHPRRLPHAVALRDHHPELGLQVVLDPEPDGPPTALRTARAAWRLRGGDASHHLVVQDDVVLCDGFLDQVRAAVTAKPAHALCFFTQWGSRTSFTVRLAALAGAAWAPLVSDTVAALAIVLPARTAEGLAEFLENETSMAEPDSAAAKRYLTHAGVPTLVSTPNLVQHLDIPSLVGNDRNRLSVCYDGNPGTPQWDGEPLATPIVPFLEWGTARALVQIAAPDAPGGLERLTTGAFLRRNGMDPGDVVIALVDHQRALDGGAELADVVGFALLHELWITACALGLVVAARRGRAPDRTRWARLALSTMPRGALRKAVPRDVLAALATPLDALLWAAVDAGADQGGSGRVIR